MKTKPMIIRVPAKLQQDFLILLDLAQFDYDLPTLEPGETATVLFVRKVLKRYGYKPCDRPGRNK